MMTLNKKNTGFFKLKVKPQKNQIKQITTRLLKKLVTLSLLVTITIAIGACVNKKPESSAQKAKTQLETLGIDANKAFFVTPSGKTTNDGSSWQKAMDLQSAIDAAFTDATKKFVLVAGGSYYADPNKTDITKKFILKDKVKIYGGFDVNAKKLTRYKDASILEGKLKAKEGANGAIHSRQILKGENLSATSILDGFLIQNALNGVQRAKGAGLLLNNSQPKLNNLTFINNKLTGSYSRGAAIYNTNNSNPSISNSSFSNNSARDGGAIYNELSSPKIHNSIFSDNFAAFRCGAICNWDNSSPKIHNSIFSNNYAEYFGGAVCNHKNSNPSISNSSFSNNFVKHSGGAIYNWDNSSPKIYNSILWNNKDKHKGTEAINNIYNFHVTSKPLIKNSILNANSAVTKQGDNTQTDFSKTDPYDFMANDTKFKNNQAPVAFTIDEKGKVTNANQALIKDKGDNALYKEITGKEASIDKDIAGNPRLVGSKIDIGVYELQE